ncbi:MAG: XRE family transcriptional regulator [Coriobacteriia bacterium]|nr:XRE family transcriptional regulator [Coriobacteriia bacterium]MCL2606700.1 XRE family transcriptional regulator [Coriobacteriia bacterium]
MTSNKGSTKISDQSASNVGQRIKSLRETHNISLEELSQRTGMTTEELAQIETANTVLNLTPLITIARALGMRLGTLLDDDDGMGPALTKACDLESASRRTALATGSSDAPLDFFSLAEGKISRHMDPFIIEVAPNAQRKLDTHEGEEFIYCMNGAVVIEYGTETFELGPGDSLYYDTVVPHQVRAAGDEISTILAVVYTPA